MTPPTLQPQTNKPNDASAVSALLSGPPRVVNIGLEMFATNLDRQGTRVVHVQWNPPARGNAQLASLLDKLRG